MFEFIDIIDSNANEILKRIEFHSGCVDGILNAMVKLTNP